MNLNITVNNYYGNSAEVVHLLKEIHMSQTDTANRITALNAQVSKIGGETQSLLDKVATLTEEIGKLGDTSPEVEAALAALEGQVGIVDALVKDIEPPVEG